MFIISNNNNRLSAIYQYINQLKIKDIKVHDLDLNNGYFLTWTNIKPEDNLHIYKDGFIIGKATFNEPSNLDPLDHNNSIPHDIHPLLHSTTISIEGSELIIKPNEHKNIYYSKNSISDFQLLIAKNEKLLPSLFGIQLLGIVGYFLGNHTLFDSVNKIPYLESLSFPSLKRFRHGEFQPREHNDEAMIERLVEIAPAYDKTAISLSGGLDSRFVLGILIRKGLRPKVYHMGGPETDIVKKLCGALDLNLTIEKKDFLNEYDYTLMSDARIYFRGGNYTRMISSPKFDEILYNGLCSEPIIGNAFKSAWKKPGTIKSIYDDLIWYAYLSNVPDKIIGYREITDKRDIYNQLKSSLSYGRTYYDFATRKQWAGWFDHLHSGLNWNNAHLADLSFFIYPVYLLAEKMAIEMGITRSAYSNFYKERLSALNSKLLPQIKVNYSEGKLFQTYPIFIKDIHKLYYEFIKRYFARRKGISEALFNQNLTYFSKIDFNAVAGFEKYFEQDLKDLILDPNIQLRTKRAAVTLNNVLKYLNAKEKNT